jgi:hypothetical protein
MTMAKRRVVFAAVWVSAALAVAVGCSGGGGGGGGGSTLDCAWLAGDNCWKTTLADASSCLPPSTETGVLSADGATCTYASGAMVTFAPPIVLPMPATAHDVKSNVTVTNAGVDCLHFESLASGGFKLVVKGQTVQEGPSGGLGLAVSCPDGTRYTSGNALQLLSCGDDGGATFGGLPGSAWSWSGTNITFELIGGSGSSGAQPVAHCSR